MSLLPSSSNGWLGYGYGLLADVVLVVHISFVLFVVFGGLLVLKWPRLLWLHLPAVTWGVLVELTGWLCPLSPLESWLRRQSGESGFEGDFVSRWLLPILYPEFLSPHIQLVLGSLVLAINFLIYACIWDRRTKHERAQN